MKRRLQRLGVFVCSPVACAPAGHDADSSERRQAPELVASSPLFDATAVYPAPMWNGRGEEFVIALAFSERMALAAELSLEAATGGRPIAELVWSEDETKVSLFVRPSFTSPRPLADETEYWLDTSSLIGASGARLRPDAGLRQQRLRFTTGRYDALLNHSCGHTFFGPFQGIGSSGEASASSPDVSTTHVEYTITLRENDGSYGGWLRARFPSPGPYRLYFDGETTVRLRETTGATRELALTATPEACPGIAYQATFSANPGEETFLHLGPPASPTRRMIVELVTEKQPAGG
jgi:hypothetical protein